MRGGGGQKTVCKGKQKKKLCKVLKKNAAKNCSTSKNIIVQAENSPSTITFLMVRPFYGTEV
jgi:hypothetical protein